MRMTSPDSKEEGSMSQPTGRRNPHLPPPLKINTSLPGKCSSSKEGKSCKTNGRTSGACSSQVPDSMSNKKSSHWAKCPPPPKQRNSQTNMTPRTTAPPPNTRTGPTVTKAADMALRRRAAAQPKSVGCPQNCVLPLLNVHGRDLIWMNPPTPQVRAHMPATGAPLRS